MILTDIGEIGVNTGDEHFVLRPCLYAMSRLGTPSEIVHIFASVMCETPHKYQLADALTVIYACAGDHDASKAFGHVVDVQAKPRLLDAKQDLKAAEYQPGLATIEQTIIIAQTLLRHGVVGDLGPLKSRKNKEPEYVKEETPPRAWGRRLFAKCDVLGKGNTPTCVGKTGAIRLPPPASWKHPHVRGEDQR